MPNIKASILSVKSDAKRHARNVAEKDRVRLASRKVLDAVEAGNADEAKSLLKEACKTIDMAAANHVRLINGEEFARMLLDEGIDSLNEFDK